MHRFYCVVHGYNTTHNGNVCRPMLDDPTTYTAQHLQAKKPSGCSDPAGNDNVQALRAPPLGGREERTPRSSPSAASSEGER